MNDGGASSTRCVLVVEDEMCLAMMLEGILANAGYVVLTASRLPGALELVDEACIDAAILDINLAGKPVFPVADALRLRGIPIMFTSGYGQDGLPEAYRGSLLLQKPYRVEPLLQALEGLLGEAVAKP